MATKKKSPVKASKKKATAAKKPGGKAKGAAKKAAKPATKKSAPKKPAKKTAARPVKAAAKPAKKAAAKPAKKTAAKPAKKTAAAKPAKKAAAAKPAKKAPVKRAKPEKAHKPLVRRDALGHLNPEYEHDLRRQSKLNQDDHDDRAFLVGKNSDDALAEELGREFVETVTSGEDEGVELRDEMVTEEIGGPFVTTTAERELADDIDESNPEDATREPFPKS